jgi:hypothetical protein
MRAVYGNQLCDARCTVGRCFTEPTSTTPVYRGGTSHFKHLPVPAFGRLVLATFLNLTQASHTAPHAMAGVRALDDWDWHYGHGIAALTT